MNFPAKKVSPTLTGMGSRFPLLFTNPGPTAMTTMNCGRSSETMKRPASERTKSGWIARARIRSPQGRKSSGTTLLTASKNSSEASLIASRVALFKACPDWV